MTQHRGTVGHEQKDNCWRETKTRSIYWTQRREQDCSIWWSSTTTVVVGTIKTKRPGDITGKCEFPESTEGFLNVRVMAGKLKIVLFKNWIIKTIITNIRNRIKTLSPNRQILKWKRKCKIWLDLPHPIQINWKKKRKIKYQGMTERMPKTGIIMSQKEVQYSTVQYSCLC